MQTQHSTLDFIARLTEKDKQRTTQLYTNALKDKENINRQSNLKVSTSKILRSRTESISSVANHHADKNWYLDLSAIEKKQRPQLVGQWLNTAHGLVQFKKIINAGEWQNQIQSRMEQAGMLVQESRKCMLIDIWCLGQISFSTLLIDYALALLKYGKGTWSVAALTNNKQYDLLSLDTEGVTLWKSKTIPSKLQLQREQLLRRVFMFAAEKQKTLESHETLAKLQFKNNNVVYFVIRNANNYSSPSNAQLIIQQQTIIENIVNVYSYSILKPIQSQFDSDASFAQTMKGLGLQLKKEEALCKRQRERYLKSVIDHLQTQLEGKQTQLLVYRQREQIKQIAQEQLLIPSQRVSIGKERYLQLKRQIREQTNQ